MVRLLNILLALVAFGTVAPAIYMTLLTTINGQDSVPHLYQQIALAICCSCILLIYPVVQARDAKEKQLRPDPEDAFRKWAHKMQARNRSLRSKPSSKFKPFIKRNKP